MVEKWIAAINSGAVPDVENAFNQVSTFENEKLYRESLKNYEEIMKNELMEKLPLTEDDVKTLHKMGKRKVLCFFQEKRMGENTVDWENKLKEKIRDTFRDVEE